MIAIATNAIDAYSAVQQRLQHFLPGSVEHTALQELSTRLMEDGPGVVAAEIDQALKDHQEAVLQLKTMQAQLMICSGSSKVQASE